MISRIPKALLGEKGWMRSGRPKSTTKGWKLLWEQKKDFRDNITAENSWQLATLTTAILNNKQLKRFSSHWKLTVV